MPTEKSAAARIEFDGVLEPNKPAGHFIRLPPDLSEQLPGRGQLRVKGSIDGLAVQSSLMPTGTGTRCLGVHKATLEKGGFSAGQRLHVIIEADLAPREVEVPRDFAKALKGAPKARKIFDAFAYTHRKEYVRWIEEAKKPETRARRIEQAIEKLSAEKKLS
jgi:hypothetical protein